MLSRLKISNIALIDSADIEFDGRLNVLSGETGSGKSVILDSINFVLGSKADKSMIRYGENEASVRAEFNVDENSPAAEAVRELDIDCDGQIIISRRYNTEGRGNIKINGNTVTASMLKTVTLRLVDVHGQSEHFFLLSEANQLKMIDSLCGDEGERIKEKIAAELQRKKQLAGEISALGGDEQERARQLDLLEYQINEISSADIRVGEYEELKTKQNLINNTEKILTALSGAVGALSDDGGCIDLLAAAQRKIGSVADLNEQYEKIFARLENLYSEAQDISQSVEDFADELFFDDREAQYVEERLELLRSLMKKYGADEESVLTYLDDCRARYDNLLNSAEKLEKLNGELSSVDDGIYALCVQLSGVRKKCAENLSKNVVEQLKSLNIPDAKFVVSFNQYDRQTANTNSSDGSDQICFMFSANKGEPLKPLSKVISGGEMSRFMLAIKTQLRGINAISTYIFDEIDAGISGMTARTVAQKFVDISRSTQIIAVSHLPQVCAASHAQFLIYKTEENSKTITRVKRLSDDEKVDEIIRLTGSVRSDAAREHARQLIAQFKK